MNQDAYEVNFDAIVGPTHNYSGLSYGNIASQLNQYTISNPREAALQGLKKMKFLADLGIKQAVLPPHERPHIPTLRSLGFTGSASEIIRSVHQQFPELLIEVSSAAAMWAANCATVSSSADSADKRVHFTAANLTSKFHRSIETAMTQHILQQIFNDPDHFVHHSPLASQGSFADEGAANHCRFCKEYGSAGIQLFVYGRYGFKRNAAAPKQFPARQTREACEALARLHSLNPDQVVFAQQHPAAIDAGAFHNDVVSVGNKNLFFFHELAFLNSEKVMTEIETKLKKFDTKLILWKIDDKDISLKDAVDSYLFNSQIVSLPNQMALIAPTECEKNIRVKTYLEKSLQHQNCPIKQIHYLNLHQSMLNGGGPACLRLRVVLTQKELSAAHPHIFLNDTLYQQLMDWINKHYRDRLHPNDLADPLLYQENQHALDQLSKILNLKSIYSFQK